MPSATTSSPTSQAPTSSTNVSESATTSPDSSFLFISEPGVGKTRLAATFPKPYFFDFDKGTASVEAVLGPPRDGVWGRTVIKDAPPKRKAMPNKGIYEYGKAWPEFLRQMDAVVERIDKGDWPFEALVWDSFTMLQNICANFAMATDSSKAGPHPGGPMQIQDYGAILNAMQAAVDNFTALPGYKIMTAHVQRDTNPLNGDIEKLILGLGQFTARAPMYFDEVYFVDTKKRPKVAGQEVSKEPEERILITIHSSYIKSARSRYLVPDGTKAHFDAIRPYLGGV